jgi:anthraniloyl-CoA monooxygenase
MNIVCIGGGPAGLYFSLLRKKAHPEDRIILIERGARGDTYGWGVVFSDQTLDNLSAADGPSANAILDAFVHWDDIDIHFRGHAVRSGGHGFAGIARQRLQTILQQRCEALGVELLFEQAADDAQALAERFDADLVIACDGLNSPTREQYREAFQPAMELRHCRYIWLGSDLPLSAFTFAFEQTEYGWFQLHAYPHAENASTIIVETPDPVWQASGLDRMSTTEGIAFCENLFSRHLEGYGLHHQTPQVPAAQGWHRFGRLHCGRWTHALAVNGKSVPLVLVGDAAHSLHFSIGSGTKLAMEDAIALVHALDNAPSFAEALTSYEQARRIEILRNQNAAANSMDWFEHIERYVHLEPYQFAYSLLTRSQRISHENLRMRDSTYLADFENRFADQAYTLAGWEKPKASRPVPPMFTPFRVRNITLKNRIVVSPMAQYSAIDGLVGDYHLVHLGSRAMGGAGLVFAEMTCISPDARITPGCPGLYHPSHTEAWKRIVDFIHANTDAKVAMQLGHAGAKGATRPMWEGMDMPLAEGAWPLVAASDQQYLAGISQWARAATLEDMERIKADFVRAAQQAEAAGFDWLELHCAHGYLLSSFISPLTNKREDEYGGTLENRCRYPLEVFAAIRSAWPQHKPISVRISANDWVEGGITPDDAVQIARLFKQAGADMVACSSGQVSKEETPVYGRMYQTPFSDRIRNEGGIATIAVGSIFEADHVNSIIAAGRSDLCAIARPHLANPHWTLTEAAKIGYTDMGWPLPYRAGKMQLERNLARAVRDDAPSPHTRKKN